MTYCETLLNCLLGTLKNKPAANHYEILCGLLTHLYSVGNKNFNTKDIENLKVSIGHIMGGWADVCEASKIGLFYPEDKEEIDKLLEKPKMNEETKELIKAIDVVNETIRKCFGECEVMYYAHDKNTFKIIIKTEE